jgi:cobalt-zinc-cadmium efflux system outer membrane protein
MVMDLARLLRRVVWPSLLGLVVLTLDAQAARAQETAAARPLTIDDALTGVLDREEVDGLLSASRRAADAAVDSAAALDNPEVSYEREQLFGGSEDESEDVIGISKTFEISGGRGLRVEAAEHRRRQVEAAGAGWRLDLERDTRLLYYRALHGQLRVEAFSDWVASLERVVAEVSQRAAAGDVSEYDLLTLERELALARAEQHREQARSEYDRLVLAAWIDEAPAAANRRWLAGEILPMGPPSNGDRLQTLVEQSPDLAVLDAGIDASRAQARAAGRSWVPSVTLSAGYKTTQPEGGARAHGFVFGVAAPLPLLSVGRGERDEAEAEHNALTAERALAASRIAGEVHGRAAEAKRLYEAALALRRDLDGQAGKLPEIAEAAYRGGELGVLELVDAYRGNLESVLRSLELELSAREARVELDRLTGEDGR